MASEQTCSASVFAVVLAAGTSRRFGSVKQLARLDGEALVKRAARIARQCCNERSILVAGHQARAVISASEGLCHFVLINDRYQTGIGSSIAFAARALAHCADALLILLADQPRITASHVNALLAEWSGDDDNIVATRFGQTRAPPILMPAATFPSLTRLSGDRGARDLLDDDRFRVTSVKFDDAQFDIDTPADLERLTDGAH